MTLELVYQGDELRRAPADGALAGGRADVRAALLRNRDELAMRG
jgi:hypothetical protein